MSKQTFCLTSTLIYFTPFTTRDKKKKKIALEKELVGGEEKGEGSHKSDFQTHCVIRVFMK